MPVGALAILFKFAVVTIFPKLHFDLLTLNRAQELLICLLQLGVATVQRVIDSFFKFIELFLANYALQYQSWSLPVIHVVEMHPVDHVPSPLSTNDSLIATIALFNLSLPLISYLLLMHPSRNWSI